GAGGGGVEEEGQNQTALRPPRGGGGGGGGGPSRRESFVLAPSLALPRKRGRGHTECRVRVQRKRKCISRFLTIPLSCFLTILSNHVAYPLGGNTHSQLIGLGADALVCCAGLLGGMGL